MAVDMQGLVSEMQSSCPRCMAQRRLHLGNRPAPVHGSLTILLFYYSSTVQSRLHLGNRPAPVHGSLTILLFYYYSSTVLFYYVKCTILLSTIPLFTILPRPQPFASRKPTCAGSRFTYYFTILLFYYYSSTVLFYYVLFYC